MFINQHQIKSRYPVQRVIVFIGGDNIIVTNLAGAKLKLTGAVGQHGIGRAAGVVAGAVVFVLGHIDEYVFNWSACFGLDAPGGFLLQNSIVGLPAKLPIILRGFRRPPPDKV